MFKKRLFGIGFTAAIMATAAPQIEVSSTPTLPMPNLAKNSSFEEGIKSWRPGKAKTPGTGVVSEGAHSGKNCYKIAGDEKSSVNLSQRITFKPPLPAGAPICSSFAMMSEEQDNSLQRPGPSIRAYHPDKTATYILSPPVPRESHDWIMTSCTSFSKKPANSILYYFCYYKQCGFSLWDDLVVKAGWVNLKIKVDGKNLKQVKVYGQLQHLIFESGALKAGTNSYKKQLKVYPMGGYCVEVTDASGAVSREFYPKDSKITKTANGGVSIMPRLKEEKIKQRAKLICKFQAPVSKDKKVCLNFNVRSCTKKINNLAGWSAGALKIKLNGKPVNPNRLIGRKVRFTRSNGRAGHIGTDSFLAFYSPWVFSIDTESPYCPVDVKDRNPFNYVLDITNLVQPGENVLEFSNNIKISPVSKVNLYLSDAEIFTK
jgi:hypothetical protein